MSNISPWANPNSLHASYLGNESTFVSLPQENPYPRNGDTQVCTNKMSGANPNSFMMGSQIREMEYNTAEASATIPILFAGLIHPCPTLFYSIAPHYLTVLTLVLKEPLMASWPTFLLLRKYPFKESLNRRWNAVIKLHQKAFLSLGRTKRWCHDIECDVTVMSLSWAPGHCITALPACWGGGSRGSSGFVKTRFCCNTPGMKFHLPLYRCKSLCNKQASV